MKTEFWSSRLTFLFATISCSVGLGNLWRFPYVAGENGGGAFVLVYLFFVLSIGVPLVMAELAIARRGQRSPVATTALISQEESGHSRWQLIGWLSIFAPLLALSFYAVVGGWSLDYFLQAAAGRFTGIDATGAESLFARLLASPVRMLLSFSLMIAAVALVVGSGIHNGIERISKFMMPALFLLLVLLAVYANFVGDAGRAWDFLFNPDFSKLTANSILIALGQSLFSIAVGTGALLAYGAYLPRTVSIPGAAWAIGLADTLAAILAGLVIFPIMFASGLDAAEGPGLIFVTLPLAFSEMPGAAVFGALFFLLVFFAAFTSGLGMMEPFVSWAEERPGLSRARAATLTAGLVWVLGLAAVFSFNLWQDFTPLDMIPQLQGRTVFSILDYVVSNFVLPVNALLIALLTGWVINAKRMREDVGIESDHWWQIWQLSVRVLAPLAILCVFLLNLWN
ncbi:MAG: sodium-dependent transporter [Gammaproteobacteria bacterium]|nr:sodium-dependent transporter [Gammaproteobacteria bacterium]